MNPVIPYSNIFRDIAIGLVQHPTRLIVHQEQITSNFHRLGVDCDSFDYPQIIGKQARHIQSFQHLLGYISARRGEKVDVSVRAPAQKPPGKPIGVRPLKAGINEKIYALLSMLLTEALGDPFKLKAFNRDLVYYLVILSEYDLEPDLLESLQSLLQAVGKVSGATIRIENDLLPQPFNPIKL